MKLKLVQRLNPLDRNETPKYYAHMENEGVAELKDLAKQITKYSSLSQGDIMSALENMVDAASLFLLMGKGVRIGRLGMLRISIKGNGALTPDDYTYNLIQRIKLNFTPSVEFKKELQDISYEIVR